MERLRNRREETVERCNVDSVLDETKERLRDIVRAEREGIDRRLQEARAQAAQGTGSW